MQHAREGHRGRTTVLLLAALLLAPPLGAQDPTRDEIARWERRAETATIIRDDWGIPHVHGKTDADAVFGLMYAQAEDGFERIETNYLNALGRLAEAEGESAIFRDLRTRLFIDPDTLKALYRESPPWLQAVMDAWADGLNYYLHTHPEVTPRVIRRFEPWMPLAFSEGSITNDVNRIPPGQVESFYGNDPASPPPTGTERPSKDHDGSNAIAIAPSNTAAGNALLLINPHTSFYFRTEVHVSSEEGLNAYGAATWGQFFLFHGFNDRLGWAHTTSGVDAVDEYLESVFERDGQLHYRYGTEERPVASSTVTLAYRTPDGGNAHRTFTVYGTHRGPIIRETDGRWVSIALMRKPVEALSQSFLRMTARDLGSFMETLELKANSTNNTMYADADGNIAFQPPQFIPRRDDRFDFRRPVDGTDPATDWQGVHALDEAPGLRNPASGWIQNTNNWPYSGAGPHSPRREAYPRYMDTFGEKPRGVHAVMLLRGRTDFTLEALREVAYDSYQPAFAQVIPSLIAAHEEIPDSHPLKRRLSEQVELLRSWDYRWGTGSVEMSLARDWVNQLWQRVEDRVPDPDLHSEVELIDLIAARSTTDEKLEALATVSDRIEEQFGTWRTAFGEINRFQRLTGELEQRFSDDAPSIPVGFSAAWTGSLADFFAPPSAGKQRRYGLAGNTFVAVVEFGDRVRAKAIRPGGQSGDPASPHFDDQSIRYAAGDLRDVYFYRSDLEGHIEREYHPGQSAGSADTGFMDAGRFDGAVEHYELAAVLRSDRGIADGRLFRAYLALGLVDRAEGSLHRARERGDAAPYPGWWHCRRALAAIFRGDPGALAVHNDSLLTTASDEAPEAWECAAFNEVFLRRFPDARAHLERYVAEAAADETPLNLGFLHLRSGTVAEGEMILGEAEARARAAVAEDGSSWEPRFELAEIAAMRGDTEMAVRHLEAAVDRGLAREWWAYHLFSPEALPDPVFEPLYDHPGFERLRTEMMMERRRMRERVLRNGSETTTRSDTVQVASPTGDKASDRANVQAAFDAVQPGGTVQFAPGTYLLGAGAKLTVPDVTVLGHPDGTVLRGCDPEAFSRDESEVVEIVFGCTGLYVQAERQTIRGLTFEYTWHGIVVGPYPTTEEEGAALRASGELPAVYPAGGQRIEGNTFRATPNGLRVLGTGEEPSVVRDNDFIDVFHAIGIYGAPLHFLDNRVTVAEPERVPFSRHPGSAVIVSPGHTDCADHVVAGNRIEGYPDPIYVLVRRGGTCRGVEIRDNTIHAARVKVPEAWMGATPTAEDSTMVGAPITLMNRTEPTPGPPETDREGVLEDILVEGNHIVGAEGLGILVQGVSRSRIAGNTIAGIQRRTPFPGITWDGFEQRWEAANGSAIWISPGSEGNEIVGNAFQDVAASAVVIEGDRNQVELADPGDAVRDLGSGNRVTAQNRVPAAQEPAHTDWRPVASPDRARVSALAYADGTVFAGTMAGLFASEDAGTSWQLRGPASRPISPLLPTAEGALLAGTYRQGILRSNDSGRTWRSVGFERNIYVVGLVQEPDGRVYAAVRGAVEDEPTGVFRSSDEGKTWLASGLETEEVYSLSLPRPGLLFAGTQRGLFRSEDGGRTWSRMGALPSEAPVSKVLAAGGHLYAAMGTRLYRIPGGGVARSTDGGRSWEPTEGLPPRTAVLDLAVREGTVFAATGDVVRGGGKGLFRLDEAETWRPAGLEDAWLRQLLDTPDGLFAGAYELGVFHSTDGRAWSHRSAGLRNWEPTSLLFDAEGLLYALSVRSLFRSADRGQSWVEMPRPEGSAAPAPWSLAVDSGGEIYLAGEGGVLVSSDRGESWKSRPIPGEDGWVFSVTLGPRGRLFAVVRGEAAYTSADGGRTWEVLDLPAPPRMALFSSPAGARFLTALDGTWRWSEGGSWRAVAEEQVMHLTACGDALFAGTYARGLLRSTDDGRTWTPVTEELRREAQQAGYMTFTSFACLPGVGVLAGTFWDGVFYRADGGSTWINVSAGLPSPTSQDFATTPDGQVFVATPAGVYASDQWRQPARPPSPVERKEESGIRNPR